MATNMPIDCDSPSGTAPHPTIDTKLSRLVESEAQAASENKPVVVGLYGVPGSGKTFLIRQLREKLGEERFHFYEGSEMIDTVVPGGLEAFQKLGEREKVQWRQLAIKTIGRECIASGRVAVVSGHFMFWPEEDETGHQVCTSSDLETYTHILYLDFPAELVAQRRQGDTQRSRCSASASHLRRWQQLEKTELRRLCWHNGILFSLVSSPQRGLRNYLSTLLLDFQRHNESYNLSRATEKLEEVLATSGGRSKLETVLVLDADKTLAAEDTGALFWKMTSSPGLWQPGDGRCPLKTLFSSPLGHSYTAFRQATLLYEEGSLTPSARKWPQP